MMNKKIILCTSRVLPRLLQLVVQYCKKQKGLMLNLFSIKYRHYR